MSQPILNPYDIKPPTSSSTVRKRGWNPLAVTLLVAMGFFFLFLMLSGIFLFSRSSGISKPKVTVGGLFTKGSIGVIEVNGVILDSKKTLERLDRFEEDEDIKAVVVRLNSPGGAVAPSQEIYEAIKKLKAKKPVIASMGSVAASGAYYIAVGAQKIYANPGTLTGSIGVIMEFANLERLYEWAKVKRYALKTGKFKDAGSEYRTMTAEERELLQTMIDDVLLQFKTAVSEGRKLSLPEVTKLADGRIFSGAQAKRVKLVDTLGTFNDAINEAAKLAKIKGKPNVVYPMSPKRGIIDYLMDDRASGEDGQSSSKLNLAGLLGWVNQAVTGESSAPITHPGIYWLWSGSR